MNTPSQKRATKIAKTVQNIGNPGVKKKFLAILQKRDSEVYEEVQRLVQSKAKTKRPTQVSKAIQQRTEIQPKRIPKKARRKVSRRTPRATTKQVSVAKAQKQPSHKEPIKMFKVIGSPFFKNISFKNNVVSIRGLGNATIVSTPQQ